ncbi:YppE family protein [Macrococcus armenti]|uniref:DUF1798 family protein n=1 Tax=Macrococcus armenti TaxID=2875764 RepID=UPI001CCE8BCB|nr:DUF1798 family protein [Macrococcus armenti]UBH21338.1 YppE family protein [Macrococcus armenti]
MLQQCIQSLIYDLEKIEKYFELAKAGHAFNFVMDVQPFTEKVDHHITLLNQYKDEITSLPLMNEKKYDLCIAHLRDISVSCFFSKTSKKVFIDQYKAVKHEVNYIKRMTVS